MIINIDTAQESLDWRANGAGRIAQNVKNLLSLTAYEIPFDRTRGLPASLLDMPAGDAANQFIAKATEQLQRFEPRAKIVSAKLKDILGGELNFEVVIDIAV